MVFNFGVVLNFNERDAQAKLKANKSETIFWLNAMPHTITCRMQIK